MKKYKLPQPNADYEYIRSEMLKTEQLYEEYLKDSNFCLKDLKRMRGMTILASNNQFDEALLFGLISL